LALDVDFEEFEANVGAVLILNVA